jgi:hypothetical protein
MQEICSMSNNEIAKDESILQTTKNKPKHFLKKDEYQ